MMPDGARAERLDGAEDAQPSLAAAVDASETSVDSLLRGRVTLVQPRRGFRASLDPLLLATFVRPPFGRFVDIGCGTGALAFSLAALDPAATGVGIELQPRLASLAATGLARNAFAERVAIVEADARHAVGTSGLAAGSFDLVATNPPFRPVRGGFVSPDSERARAHHEVTLTLAAWIDVAAALVNPRGRVAAVFVASRRDELVQALRARGLAVRRLRLVHARLDEPPSRVLVEAAPSWGAPPIVEPPLALRGPRGHSDEILRLLGDDPALESA